MRIGLFPTPVFRADALCTPGADLWIKDDGPSAGLYGGNKVRKLERILGEAERRGARRIVTTGAGGSHHVLATAIYARRMGLPVVAVLYPQPWTEHAEETLRASLAAGIEPVVVRSMAGVPWRVARVFRRGDYVVAPGGSNVGGTLGYVSGAGELAAQLRGGTLPEPDVIIAPLGSGGTVAGILAGVSREGLRSRVVGVTVAFSPRLARPMVLALARRASDRHREPDGWPRLSDALEVDGAQLGRGYGHVTAAGERATEAAARAGLALDPTYTAKTFARVLEELARPHPGARRVVLYWHTLSSRPLAPLLASAPAKLPAVLTSLLVR